MRKLIALEEFAQFAIALVGIGLLQITINYYILIPGFFAPDLFAVGYFINKRIGAIFYDFSHHKLVAIALIQVGWIVKNDLILLAGLMTYAHSCFYTET